MEQPTQRRRDFGGESLPVDLSLEHGGEDLRQAVARERPLAGDGFEEADAEGPDVRSPVDRSALQLLRAHECRGAHQATLAGEVALDRGEVAHDRLHRLGESEVEDLDPAVGRDLDVRRLQVAVDEPFFVRRPEPLGDLDEECGGLVSRHRSAPDAIGQRVPFHQLHHERAAAVLGLAEEAVQRRYVGMIQRRQSFRFALEPLEPVRVAREAVRQSLDRDLAPEARVARAVDNAHATSAEGGEDLEFADAIARLEGHFEDLTWGSRAARALQAWQRR